MNPTKNIDFSIIVVPLCKGDDTPTIPWGIFSESTEFPGEVGLNALVSTGLCHYITVGDEKYFVAFNEEYISEAIRRLLGLTPRNNFLDEAYCFAVANTFLYEKGSIDSWDSALNQLTGKLKLDL